ncbi:MAG: hypothetical protein AB7N76_27055 [Planctomycetota bacterium]
MRALVLLLSQALLLSVGPLARAEDFRWESDLPAARSRSVKEGRPLLLVFRCPP